MKAHQAIALAGAVWIGAAAAASPQAARAAVPVVEEAPVDEEVRLGEELQPECTEKLKRIWTAIDEYRTAHGELPMWLSDLMSDGLIADSTALICPVTLETGRAPSMNLYFPDPRVPKSYYYEFCPMPIGPGPEPGDVLTMREWKTRQQELVGGRVPLVRCVLHGAVLNIGAEGDFFESDLTWESAVDDPEIRAKLPPYPDDRPPAPTDEEWIGMEAPSATLELLGGGWIDPGDRPGEVVVLHFWTLWGGSSTQVLPYLEELAEEYADRGVVCVAVEMSDPPDRVQEFLEQRELELTVGLDRDRSVTSRYGGMSFPRTVVIGRDGRVAAVVGAVGDWPRTMRRHIEDALD
jgi:thiol-disulfide isomerase/thioredoxin